MPCASLTTGAPLNAMSVTKQFYIYIFFLCFKLYILIWGVSQTVIDFAEAFLTAHICKCADWPQAIHMDCSCRLLVLPHALDARNIAAVDPLWCGPLWCGPWWY